jgi:transposase
MPRNTPYSDEFKRQIVALKKNGKSVTYLMREYNISRATIYKWLMENDRTGSFKAADNRSEAEKELIRIHKENQELKMENDILKQAALIMGRKQK